MPIQPPKATNNPMAQARLIWEPYFRARTPQAAAKFIRVFQASPPPVQAAILALVDEALRVSAVSKSDFERLSAEIKKLKAPPIVYGTLLEVLKDNGETCAVVAGQGKRFEANIASDICQENLVRGRTVGVNSNSGCVVRARGMAPGDTTGTIDRILDDGRFLVEAGGQFMVSEPSAELTDASEKVRVGDRVRVDRDSQFLCAIIHGASVTSEFEPEDLPAITMDDIGGLDMQKERMLLSLVFPLEHPKLFGQYLLERPRGVLLSGPPGCGKTMLSKAVCHLIAASIGLASERDQRCIFFVKGGQFFRKYVGESGRSVRALFETARETARDKGLAVVLIDEIDAVAGQRLADDHAGGAVNQVVVALQAEMDGLGDSSRVVVIGTTNRRDLLSPAILRPGRFSEIIEFGPPDQACAEAILRAHLRRQPRVDVEAVTERALALVYDGEDESTLAWLTYRDGEREAVRPDALISGAMLAEAVRKGALSACCRDAAAGLTEASGLTPDDVALALVGQLTARTKSLRPHNVRAHLPHLPDDRDVVAVQPVEEWEIGHRFAA